MKKPNRTPSVSDLYSLVADLVDLLISTGYNEKDLIWTLNQYGITKQQAKEWYGLPYDGK